MDRKVFWEAVENLRSGIIHCGRDIMHVRLDKLVKTVIQGGSKMAEELSLQDDVARVIKRIKEAKENDQLKEQAVVLIDKIKTEL